MANSPSSVVVAEPTTESQPSSRWPWFFLALWVLWLGVLMWMGYYEWGQSKSKPILDAKDAMIGKETTPSSQAYFKTGVRADD
jgi:hypothetical protein